MPNWCSNRVTFTGLGGDIRDALSNPNGFFHTFVPDPHSDEDYTSLGYPWRLENWGTKWDVFPDDIEILEVGPEEIEFRFDTAWGPPLAFYAAMEAKGYFLEAYYWEPGMCFCGSYVSGVNTRFDIPEYPSEIKKVIPEAILDHFPIIDIEDDDV